MQAFDRRRDSWLRLGCLGAALWLIAGCSTMNECPACPDPNSTKPAPTSQCGATPDEMAEAIVKAFKAPAPPAQDDDAPEMLFLSAGGSYGAWGAGVLAGWGAKGTRPKFDIVIGASTGALLGTFALLGTMDTEMTDVYTKVNNTDIFRRRFFLAMPFASSINTLEPLRELVENTFTHAVIDKVKAVYEQEGRQLWVGTTNLDTGEFCSWNLSQIAAEGRYEDYVSILIASSANPGVFAPEFIPNTGPRKDKDLHADGGVRHQLYQEVAATAFAKYGAARLGRPMTTDAPVTYAIANGQLAVRRQCVVEHIAPIILRSMQIMMTSALVSDLHRVDAGAKAATPAWDLKTSYVPEDYPLWPSADVFIEADMKHLYDKGFQAGLAESWVDGVPSPGVSPTECLPAIALP